MGFSIATFLMVFDEALDGVHAVSLGGHMVILVKPQFELDREATNELRDCIFFHPHFSLVLRIVLFLDQTGKSRTASRINSCPFMTSTSAFSGGE